MNCRDEKFFFWGGMLLNSFFEKKVKLSILGSGPMNREPDDFISQMMCYFRFYCHVTYHFNIIVNSAVGRSKEANDSTLASTTLVSSLLYSKSPCDLMGPKNNQRYQLGSPVSICFPLCLFL